jgi:hypothetical protein
MKAFMAEYEPIPPKLLARFTTAVEDLERRLSRRSAKLEDENVPADLRQWLDGDDEPLDWQGRGVTPDEYFFITTLYGTMTLDGQRTMIRKFFGPLFVKAAKRDIRNFRSDLGGYTGLRSGWMKARLCKMGALLRRNDISMSQYVAELRRLEKKASPDNPTPALDRIVSDHGAMGVKTLSVFVRDCVGGNCFPIDSRVEKQLRKYRLPVDEILLVRMSLAIGKNPRKLARIFYEADWW